MKRKILHISLSVFITAFFILLAIFVFGDSYLRFAETIKDLGTSIRYYFCWIFNIENTVMPGVIDYSKVITWNTILPEDFEVFAANTKDYFGLLFSKENLAAYGSFIGDKLGVLGKILVICLPLVLAVILIIKKLYARHNTKHNQDTVPLKVFKKLSAWIYHPIKRFISDFMAFLKENAWIWKLWLAIWIFNLNIASIICAFIAYYLYFSVSYKFETLYVQVVKLFIDLQVIFHHIPWWILVFAIYPIFNNFRKKIAIARLRHFEAKNCGFINELPIVSMSCGSMGKKKTTLITDMALSQEVMFRQKAFSILQKTDMKFPYFPWICFENELKNCMEHHTVYNLATVKEWVKLKKKRFAKHHNIHLQLYGYDYEKYGSHFNDALRISNLFDALETYALAYFIYVIESSLIVANYSIRTDAEMLDEGNFPMWYANFFPEGNTEGRHAKILDFDTLRLGRKVIEENPNIGSFEFGVVVISEVGKERGNNLELREVKKGTDETNQKNDLFNAWLKMCRHSATVDNYPFIKVFADEQRPESWGADARDLCDIVHIVSSGDLKLAMPFYTIEDMLTEWAFDGFSSLYYDFRFRRGDNTLLVHILKSITGFLWRRNMRI